MDSPADRRRHPRLSVGSGYTARFRAADRAYAAVALADLSAGGVCLRMEAREAEPLQKGMAVATLYLEHPGLPGVPLQGQISWLMGKVPGKVEGMVLVGVEFVNLHPKIEAALAQHVLERIGAPGQAPAGPTRKGSHGP